MSNNYVAGMGMPRIRPRGANAPAGLLAVILMLGGTFVIEQGAQNFVPALYWVGGVLIALGILTPMSLKMPTSGTARLCCGSASCRRCADPACS